jgi:hypothetical protein
MMDIQFKGLEYVINWFNSSRMFTFDPNAKLNLSMVFLFTHKIIHDI